MFQTEMSLENLEQDNPLRFEHIVLKDFFSSCL